MRRLKLESRQASQLKLLAPGRADRRPIEVRDLAAEARPRHLGVRRAANVLIDIVLGATPLPQAHAVVAAEPRTHRISGLVLGELGSPGCRVAQLAAIAVFDDAFIYKAPQEFLEIERADADLHDDFCHFRLIVDGQNWWLLYLKALASNDEVMLS